MSPFFSFLVLFLQLPCPILTIHNLPSFYLRFDGFIPPCAPASHYFLLTGLTSLLVRGTGISRVAALFPLISFFFISALIVLPPAECLFQRPNADVHFQKVDTSFLPNSAPFTSKYLPYPSLVFFPFAVECFILPSFHEASFFVTALPPLAKATRRLLEFDFGWFLALCIPLLKRFFQRYLIGRFKPLFMRSVFFLVPPPLFFFSPSVTISLLEHKNLCFSPRGVHNFS